jgi:MFS family permease
MVGAQAVTRFLYPVFGPRRVMVGGLLLLASALALLALVDANTNLWWARLDMFVVGYGMSHVLVTSQAAGFATISAADTARAATLFNAVRQLGSAVGVAILTTVVATVGPVERVGRRVVPDLAAYHAAFLVAAFMALLAGLCALTVNDADAAPTMVRRHRTRATRTEEPGSVPEPVPAAS